MSEALVHALEAALPADGAYHTARLRAPDTLAKESWPLKFLRRFDNDIAKAAEGLEAYWVKRAELFGEDRAYLPMNITGHGALNAEDIEVLKTDSLVILPDDDCGCPVVFVDRTRVPQTMYNSPARSRATFYVFFVLGENPKAQTEGVVFLRYPDPYAWTRCNIVSVINMITMTSLNEKLVCFLLPDAAAEAHFRKERLSVIKESMGESFNKVRLLRIGRDLPESIQLKNLPAKAGGHWTDRWLEERLELETARDQRDGTTNSSRGTNDNNARANEQKSEATPEPAEGLTVAPTVQHKEEAALRELDKALQRIPTEEKADYLEAIALVPLLVEKECDRRKFLRRFDYDTQLAAAKIVEYWQLRKKLFAERALLPMDCTGDGAMTEVDVALLKMGCGAVLPPDKRGRPVVFLDRTRINLRFDHAECNRHRFLFYVLHVAGQNDAAHTEGVIILRALHDTNFQPDVDLFLNMLTLMLKVHSFHLVFEPPNPAAMRILRQTVVESVRRVMNQRFGKQAFIYFFNPGAKEPPEELLSNSDLEKANIPTSIAGDWTFEGDFVDWLEVRMHSERAGRCKLSELQLRVLVDAVVRSYQQQSLKEGARSFDSDVRSFHSGLAVQTLGEVKKNYAETKPLVYETPPSPSMRSSDHPDMLGSVALGTKRKVNAKRTATGNANRQDKKARSQHNSPAVDTEHAASRTAWSEVARAIESLPVKEKQAYVQAQQNDAALVAAETSPWLFLHCEKDDAVRAAQRLVAHWRLRMDLFGKRACLPMTQTGEGALSRADVQCVASAVFCALPNDAFGRPVLFFDSSKVSDSSRDALRRVAFYFLSVMAGMPGAQENGIVILITVECLDDAELARSSVVGIVPLMPVQIACLHILTYRSTDDQKGLSHLSAASVARALAPIPCGANYVHQALSRSRVAVDLRAHGLVKSALPKSIGGEWGVERFVEWQELRTRFEWGLPPAASHKGIDKIFDFSSIKQPADLTKEERTERSRRMNVLHSRRKRERERIEIEVLKEQCDDLRHRNQDARLEAKRLEDLLDSAYNVVSRSGSESSPRPQDSDQDRESAMTVKGESRTKTPGSTFQHGSQIESLSSASWHPLTQDGRPGFRHLSDQCGDRDLALIQELRQRQASLERERLLQQFCGSDAPRAPMPPPGPTERYMSFLRYMQYK